MPLATYRLQFHRGFTFADAAALRRPTSRDLGVSDVLRLAVPAGPARQQHGYDVVDHSRAQPRARRRGGLRRARRAPCASAAWAWSSTSCPTTWASRDADNALVAGRAGERPGVAATPATSTSTGTPVKPELRGQGAAADPRRPVRQRAGERASSGSPTSDGALRRPLLRPRAAGRAARPTAAILGQPAATTLVERARRGARRTSLELPEHPDRASTTCPPRTETDPAQVAERNREKEVIKRRLAALADASPDGARRHRRRRRATFNGNAGRPAQLRRARRAARRAGLPAGVLAGGGRGDQLPPLLRHQRPGRHPHGATRRSSTATHALIFAPAGRGQGRPACASTTPTACATRPSYFRRLQEQLRPGAAARPARRRPAAGAALAGGRRPPLRRASAERRTAAWPLYVVAEKILGARTSALPRRLGGRTAPPATTSSTPVNGLFVDRAQPRGASTQHLRAASPATRPTSRELVYDAQAADHAGRRWPASSTCSPTSSTGSPSSNRRYARLHAQQPAPAPCARSSPASRSTAPTSPAGEAVAPRDRGYVEQAVARGQAAQPAHRRAGLRLRPRHAAAAHTPTTFRERGPRRAAVASSMQVPAGDRRR